MNNKILGAIGVSSFSAIAIAYSIFIEGNTSSFSDFISLQSFGFVLGVGGAFTYMKSHELDKNGLAKELGDNLVFSGWLGFMIGIMLVINGYNPKWGAEQLLWGGSACLTTVLYGYILGRFAESFLAE